MSAPLYMGFWKIILALDATRPSDRVKFILVIFERIRVIIWAFIFCECGLYTVEASFALADIKKGYSMQMFEKCLWMYVFMIELPKKLFPSIMWRTWFLLRCQMVVARYSFMQPIMILYICTLIAWSFLSTPIMYVTLNCLRIYNALTVLGLILNSWFSVFWSIELVDFYAYAEREVV